MPESGDQASGGPIKLRAPARASVAAAQVEALLAPLDGATEPAERAEILIEVARRLRDDLGDMGQTIDALLEAWKIDPTQEAILDVLEPVVRAERRWAEVLETTRTLASRERATPRAIAYAKAMVRWLTREVPDADLARQWLER